jgi:hypothetical protein
MEVDVNQLANNIHEIESKMKLYKNKWGQLLCDLP